MFVCPLLMFNVGEFLQLKFYPIFVQNCRQKEEVESLIQFIRRRNRLHVWFLSLTERLSDPSYFLPFSLYREPCNTAMFDYYIFPTKTSYSLVFEIKQFYFYLLIVMQWNKSILRKYLEKDLADIIQKIIVNKIEGAWDKCRRPRAL